jgi:hypothetical protein
MAGFYSLRVFSPGTLVLQDELVTLAPGPNTFNCLIKDLPDFREKLGVLGVRIDQVNQLDAPEGIEVPDEVHRLRP